MLLCTIFTIDYMKEYHSYSLTLPSLFFFWSSCIPTPCMSKAVYGVQNPSNLVQDFAANTKDRGALLHDLTNEMKTKIAIENNLYIWE